MKVETILFGVIEIPDTKELVETELLQEDGRCISRMSLKNKTLKILLDT